MSEGPAYLVMCTAPEAEAQALADDLLGRHLIACANLVGPVRSRYRWDGAIEEAAEIVLLMKTVESRLGELRDRIAAVHSYDVPEVIELPVASGLPAYLAWVAASCAPPAPDPS